MSYHPNCTISGPDNFGKKWRSRVTGQERELSLYNLGSVRCAVAGLTGTGKDAVRAAQLSARACVRLARIRGVA